MSARRSATDEGSALLSMRAREYRAGISRLNGARGRVGVCYGMWTAGTDRRPARQAIYGIYGVDRGDPTGERFYVECEGRREVGGVLMGLPSGGPRWVPPGRFWLHVDTLSSVQMFGEEEQ